MESQILIVVVAGPRRGESAEGGNGGGWTARKEAERRGEERRGEERRGGKRSESWLRGDGGGGTRLGRATKTEG